MRYLAVASWVGRTPLGAVLGRYCAAPEPEPGLVDCPLDREA